MDNDGNGETKTAKTKSRKDDLRVQVFYLRGQLDSAEQLLRSAQKIAYNMFGESVNGTQNGELAFLSPPKKRRRPRSPEAIARAVQTRKENQEANAKRMRELQAQVRKLGGDSTGKTSKTKTDKAPASQPSEAAAKVA